MGRIIAAEIVDKSDRPSRHRGYVTRWRLRDRDKAVTLRDRIQKTFDEQKSATVTPAALKQLTLLSGVENNGKAD